MKHKLNESAESSACDKIGVTKIEQQGNKIGTEAKTEQDKQTVIEGLKYAKSMYTPCMVVW